MVAVGPGCALYGRDGRRRIAPPLRFGLGVFVHLARHGRSYDVVHTASFPYFSLLAAGALRPFRRYRLVVDWHEIWTRDYWREYLGAVSGSVGWRVQQLCVRIPQRAFCFSRLHERRLREEGFRGELTVLRGQYAGGPGSLVQAPGAADGRVRRPPHPREARARARPRDRPRPRADPRPPLRDLRRRPRSPRGAPPREPRGPRGGRRRARASSPAERVEQALASALCLVLPSRREGYGLVVVEAASTGTPSVVVADPDNAATEFVEEGVNGYVAPSAASSRSRRGNPQAAEAGPTARRSTARVVRAESRCVLTCSIPGDRRGRLFRPPR